MPTDPVVIRDLRSSCCGAWMVVKGRTTQYWMCLECHQACDALTEGDSATVHYPGPVKEKP